ncbi:MAG: dihydropteridine reductase [Candidatus Enteromonas sp.]|nr:dihydropteridine reductase [Candidatus Enteromonas sp.]
MNLDKVYAESIAKEYAKKEQTKVIQLKKLDQRVKLPAQIFTFTIGIISALILGIGMCFSMGVLGGGETLFFVLGIILGIIGIAGVSVNYPLYSKVLASRKEKYAADVMALAKEIVSEE